MSDKKNLTQQQILELVASGAISSKEAGELLNTKKSGVTYKVSQKGAVSFYGIRRRMPITLYIEEINQLVGVVCESTNYNSEFAEFVKVSGSTLSKKDKPT